MNPAALAENVTYRSGNSLLVDRLSLSVDGGEIVGVVGPNGAGKTTLLRILAGDLTPLSGIARIQGVDPARTTPRDLARLRAFASAGGVPENPFTVRETVAMGRYPHRRATIEPGDHDAMVAATMEQTDVAHLEWRTVSTLSTGERQRVGLAQVVVQETPVLLLDEPTSSLDIGHQEQVMRLLRSLAGRGTAVVAVLHDVNLAAAHADRILLLDAGRTLALGSPSEVLTGETLSSVYRQSMQVIAHPYRDCPLVLTVDHPED